MGEQDVYWILDTDGWLYWAQPLEFGIETAHILDSVELLIELEKALAYTVDVKLQAVSADLDSTTGTGDYKGGINNWKDDMTESILPLFGTFAFTIDLSLGTSSDTYTLQVNDDEGNNFVVDWCDGVETPYMGTETMSPTHIYTDYPTETVYTVKISGIMLQ